MSWFVIGLGMYLGYLAYNIWHDPNFQEKLKNVEE